MSNPWKRKVKRLFLPIVFFFATIFLTALSFSVTDGGEGPRQTTGTAVLKQIEQNLRDIEHAKIQWSIENRKSEWDPVTLDDLTEFLPLKTVPDTVFGETYTSTTVQDFSHAHLPGGLMLNGKGGPFSVTSF